MTATTAFARLEKVRATLKKDTLDALFLSASPNISYLTDCSSRDAYLLILQKRAFYLTDGRYLEESKKNLPGAFELIAIKSALFKEVTRLCKKTGPKTVGFEASHLSYSSYEKLRAALPIRIRLAPTQGIVEDLRQLKSEEETAKIKKAVLITIQALRHIRTVLEPGRSELEIAAELERFIRCQGARTSAFDVIVASGPNSCFPHHLTGERIIKNNEPVLIDIGVDYNGYKSDLTRVFFLGRITPLVRKIYTIVRQAQDRALRSIRPGVAVRKIDAAARRYISQKGYGKSFTHSLGHGVGLQVHEAPRISRKEQAKVAPGMVFTLEPAIYLPGAFGIRIEDMVIVTKEGVEKISVSLNQ